MEGEPSVHYPSVIFTFVTNCSITDKILTLHIKNYFVFKILTLVTCSQLSSSTPFVDALGKVQAKRTSQTSTLWVRKDQDI